MEIIIHLKNTENVQTMTASQRVQIEEIVNALITVGGLTGVRGGQTIIHFDADGVFRSVELKYQPWVKRKIDTRY